MEHTEEMLRNISISKENTKSTNTAEVFGYLASSRAVGKKKIFIVIREGSTTVQGVISSPMEETRSISTESYVRVTGIWVETKTPVTSCTIKHQEIQVDKIEVLSKAEELPFQVKDVSWTAKEREENTLLPTVGMSKRLDYRYIDLRGPETRSIFVVYSGILQAFRRTLESKGYHEIKTPKILGGASEGGAEVFNVNYFENTATLAQSPQLYKQLAIIGGLERVFEIGPCFRAENSNTGRHLTEFTGVDLEIELKEKTYLDLTKEIYSILKTVIEEVQSKYKTELDLVKTITGTNNTITLTDTPIIIPFTKAIDILKEIGREAEYNKDIGTEDERLLGKEIKKRYKTDLFVITEYPETARPFYTSLIQSNPEYTQSFDFIFKGEEILSGAERIHQKSVLEKRLNHKQIPLDSVKSYLEAFSYGAPRHGGCGIGLERVVKLILGLSDIHKCSMFPRDPSRLYP
ncbi:aspartyl-tRNA synthetase [Nematocida sp. AWRm80]|nr:aspartyl-tRNA synthetase [Nematocida sp. AWRm80]